MKHRRSLGKLSASLRILMAGALLLPFTVGVTSAQDAQENEPQLAPPTTIGGEGWEVPEALQEDPRLHESLDTWGRELAHRDSLQGELEKIHGRATVIALRMENLARDPNTSEIRDRGQAQRLLSEGERLREEDDRISVELALSEERIRLAARELAVQLDVILQDMRDPLPRDVVDFRERLLAWEGEISFLPTVEVVIRPDDTPDVLREKAGYLRDLADGLDNLANRLQSKLETLRWQQRLLEGAEQVLDDAIFLDEGAAGQDQGEAPLRIRIEGREGPPFARESSVLLVTPEQQWELGDLLDAEPASSGELESFRTLLQGAVQDVAFQRDSIRAQADRLEEEATLREIP